MRILYVILIVFSVCTSSFAQKPSKENTKIGTINKNSTLHKKGISSKLKKYISNELTHKKEYAIQNGVTARGSIPKLFPPDSTLILSDSLFFTWKIQNENKPTKPFIFDLTCDTCPNPLINTIEYHIADTFLYLKNKKFSSNITYEWSVSTPGDKGLACSLFLATPQIKKQIENDVTEINQSDTIPKIKLLALAIMYEQYKAYSDAYFNWKKLLAIAGNDENIREMYRLFWLRMGWE